MADITLSDALAIGEGSIVDEGVAGATIAAGQVIYRNSSGVYALAQGDTAVKAAVAGIAVNGAKSGQPIKFLKEGTITGLSGLTTGVHYVVSQSLAGAVQPMSDNASGDYPSYVGLALSSSILKVKINISSVAI